MSRYSKVGSLIPLQRVVSLLPLKSRYFRPVKVVDNAQSYNWIIGSSGSSAWDFNQYGYFYSSEVSTLCIITLIFLNLKASGGLCLFNLTKIYSNSYTDIDTHKHQIFNLFFLFFIVVVSTQEKGRQRSMSQWNMWFNKALFDSKNIPYFFFFYLKEIYFRI